MVNRLAILSGGLTALCALLALDPRAARALDPAARLVARVEVYGAAPDAATLRRACGEELRCVAQKIADRLGPRAHLERVAHPSTDTIRWAETEASLGAVVPLPDGRRLIALDRFGRKAGTDLAEAIGSSRDILLDLRGNSGGDFGRMLRIAGLLLGPRPKAVALTHKNQTKFLDLPRIDPLSRPRRLSVLVGPATASSAEVLAALLRHHGGARLLGTRTAGKNYLLRVIPVDQTWRLLVPAERIAVPGEKLAGGLRPDAPLSPGLLAALAP